MSVLACDRYRCPNIICDRLIFNYSQYICEDCWKELLKFKNNWSSTLRQNDVRKHIEAFMETEPGSYNEDLTPDEIEKEFRRLTGQR